MKINRKKLEIAMATTCMTSRDLLLKSELSRGTFLNVVTGKNVKPATMGRIAKSLGVSVTEIIED